VDTTVLRRANVSLSDGRGEATLLSRRILLLRRIRARQICVLISPHLVHEYQQQLFPIQNEFIRSFLELITKPDAVHVISNWKPSWSGGDRGRARKCRYPQEDDHVLRTAIRSQPSTIYTEEGRMLQSNACVYRHFRVHIQEP
jgi:hypothetical protein